MERKLRPHGAPVTAVRYSAHGHVILSAGKNGLLAVSNPDNGNTLRVLNDHKGAQITSLQCVAKQDGEDPPPSLAAFCPTDPGLVVYTGYGVEKEISFYSLARKRMERKLRPHGAPVTAVRYSAHGHVILSAGKNGLLAVSNPDNGNTLRVLNDHKGAQITSLQCVAKQDGEDPPPSLAAFCPTDPGLVVYTGYGVEKEISFYSLARKRLYEVDVETEFLKASHASCDVACLMYDASDPQSFDYCASIYKVCSRSSFTHQ
ncbi:hypothetical protein NHX12_017350 [Muraenolepis orangiensis]|uniref:WDR90 4th beta-propeller domain-containing protein n=1 Tax=Muraenolepis orangiensis TaxID=630683 RepID=A0A9Q0F0I2_9TELE|nr:hypothetical protein NHX12_017350 [Muraenolepis orangiensis]